MSLWKRILPLVIVGVLGLGTGCTTVANYERANTLGQGKFQFAVEPGALGVRTKTTTSTPNGDGTTSVSSTNSTEALFSFSGAFRYGVTDKIDIGGRIGSNGLEFLSKFQLTDSNSGLIVSLAPRLSGFFLASSDVGAGFATISLPLLLGVPVGEHQFVFGPKIYDIMVFGGGSGTSGVVNALMLGGSVGFAFKVSEKFQILPEFAMVVPVVGSAASSDGSSASATLNPQGFMFQAGVALLFGAH